MSHVDITIAICTYNGAERIPDVLDALNLQQETEHLTWEVLVIDNASQDHTHEVVQQYADQDNGKYLLRYVFESQKGLAFARNRAVLEARGNLVAFLDDDNIPAANWILKATEFAQKSPKVGAFGGKIKGQFEAPPPKDFNKIAVFLAILDRGEVAHCYTPQRGVLPPGAGLVVRRQTWLDNNPQKALLTGRTQTSLMAGEDLEVLAHIQKVGWEIWYTPEMVIHHKIPQSRLEEEYLLKLVWGIGICRHHIRVARYHRWQAVYLTPLHIINDIYKLLDLGFTFERASEKNLAKRVEFTYRLATLLSPLVFVKTVFDQRFYSSS